MITLTSTRYPWIGILIGDIFDIWNEIVTDPLKYCSLGIRSSGPISQGKNSTDKSLYDSASTFPDELVQEN